MGRQYDLVMVGCARCLTDVPVRARDGTDGTDGRTDGRGGTSVHGMTPKRTALPLSAQLCTSVRTYAHDMYVIWSYTYENDYCVCTT